MLNYSNPYDVLSETISFENVQLMGEMISLKCMRGRYVYTHFPNKFMCEQMDLVVFPIV